MSVRITLNDRELIQALEKATADGLAVATEHYRDQLKIAVNKPNTGTPGRGRTIYNNSSKPGEPPRKRTGRGQRGIVREINRKKIAARVGVTRNAIYMFYLEMGTSRVARRPWLMSTLNKHRNTMARLLMTKIQKALPNR